jgi:MFS family permease
MLTDQQRNKAFNIIIVTQCLGMLSSSFFQNGFFLNYFTKLGISSSSIAFLIAGLPSLVGALLMLPFAYLADRKGKMRLALIGQVLVVGGLALVFTAGWFGPEAALAVIVGAIIVGSIGGSLQGASWFALLSPIIPREIRGRFFGRLRVTFQTVTIVFSLLIAKALGISHAMAVFQGIVGVAVVAQTLRYFTYSRIPELEKEHDEVKQRQSFWQSLVSVFQISGYGQFNGYILLITLFTSGVPIVFGLMQKDVFGFSPAQITLMGTFFLAGSVAGNVIGGPLVDRLGTRIVFMLAHISYAVVILGMLARHWVPWSLPLHAGLCAFFFSLLQGTKGIATTSEMLGLIPAGNRSLSTSVCMTLFSLGAAASGMFVSRSIAWGILSPEWQVLGRDFTAYDTLLLAFASMILLLLMTIGLVPKIMKKAQLFPSSGYPRI